eukprot:TRINITY_DN6807_c0_g1_i1.p1 TRINITY_DN6807_c0_g1~~TRINITY_DN6807_c0_g1_i1.p1  ORF type:complete len:226 (+),score=57.48 TRINITY_DN6807_c0_g1_i1:290-967(+)
MDKYSLDSKHPDSQQPQRKQKARNALYGIPWSDEEHELFLKGLEQYGRGEWTLIAKNLIKTRTPSQVASHAQKYFKRQESAIDFVALTKRKFYGENGDPDEIKSSMMPPSPKLSKVDESTASTATLLESLRSHTAPPPIDLESASISSRSPAVFHSTTNQLMAPHVIDKDDVLPKFLPRADGESSICSLILPIPSSLQSPTIISTKSEGIHLSPTLDPAKPKSSS